MLIRFLEPFTAIERFWTVLGLVGLSGMFLFNKTVWSRQPGFDNFDPAEKLGLGGYGIYLQLLSLLLFLGGLAGFLLVVRA